jgi:hypothetical protein
MKNPSKKIPEMGSCVKIWDENVIWVKLGMLHVKLRDWFEFTLNSVVFFVKRWGENVIWVKLGVFR